MSNSSKVSTTALLLWLPAKTTWHYIWMTTWHYIWIWLLLWKHFISILSHQIKFFQHQYELLWLMTEYSLTLLSIWSVYQYDQYSLTLWWIWSVQSINMISTVYLCDQYDQYNLTLWSIWSVLSNFVINMISTVYQYDQYSLTLW